MIQVAVMGHGVVGSGVVEVLLSHHDSIAKRAKEEINVKYILDLRDFPGLPYSEKFTKDFEVIASDPEIRIVVEVMGGVHPAFEFVSRCLAQGKSVVTSNKELVAEKGAELLQLAEQHNANFLFEASVGGGIPIIRPMVQCLAANEVKQIAGILNGTTNFILTKMIREQMSFEDALALAQKLGYAERNPAADIEGHDTCRKICILASLAFGRHVYPRQVHTEGITGVSLADVEYADGFGCAVKLLGCTHRTDDGTVYVMTAPYLIPRESQLAGVDDVFNAIMVEGDETGDVLFYGKGAGKYPTASAVVADVIDCAKHLEARKYLSWADGGDGVVADYRKTAVRKYFRVCASSSAEAAAAAEKVFGTVTFLSRADAPAGEIAFVTSAAETEEALDQKCAELAGAGCTVASQIRLADFEASHI
ncbi:MAG: homoserine dehydrogenase [Firmicutes bacterium]|nr:homoserine dehydrogenase [Bacillota bacterium]